MNKHIATMIALTASCFLLASCQNESASVSKPLNGIPAAFDDPLGFYNEHPSFVVDGEQSYCFYTRNEVSFSSESESIYVRRGKKNGSAWTFEDGQIALSPSSGSWDSAHVFEADVIGGSFTYSSEKFDYLMAYSGNSNPSSRKGSQIGLAVSHSPTGPFLRVSQSPFIAWDASDYASLSKEVTDGACSPSLVNVDGEGQIVLFYSLFNPNTGYSCKYFAFDASVDLGSLESRQSERGYKLSAKGLSDMSDDPCCLFGDFALADNGSVLLCVRDYLPISVIPPAVAGGVQIVKAPFSILKETISSTSPSWDAIDDKISSLDTAVWDQEGREGYDRVYSGSFLSDGQGAITSLSSFSISFTSSVLKNSDENYKFVPMVHIYDEEASA